MRREFGVTADGAAEDVGGQAPVAGADFDQIEGCVGGPHEGRHLGNLCFEQLAEEGADVDAGEEIARTPGSLGGAGVVAELWIVERELHERGDRQGASFVD